jgi:beta-N-acetylhexosaminidase
MLGQLFMVGVKAETLSAEELSAFNDLAVGGFILFKHNLTEPEQIVTLCRSLWDLGGEHPPFIAIDQEGGRVHRLPLPFSHFPPAAALASSQRPDLAYQIGRATAAELTMAGINLNFAPVLDVDSNPQNPIIGDRSFGRDPQQVIRFSEATMAGLRDGGIIPCGKHFPGHGDTVQDPHWVLPVVKRPLTELQACELLPFVHACRGNIESLMTAHVLYGALDPQWPATLSQKIVTGLLRRQLGYDGVVFSDDLEMKAISDHYRDEQAAALCVRAGVDVLLYGHELDKALRAFEFIAAQATRNSHLRTQLEASYRRTTQLKGRFLKTFTGVMNKSLEFQLVGLGHQRLVDAIYGNL